MIPICADCKWRGVRPAHSPAGHLYAACLNPRATPGGMNAAGQPVPPFARDERNNVAGCGPDGKFFEAK